jgi:hypothetical protein
MNIPSRSAIGRHMNGVGTCIGMLSGPESCPVEKFVASVDSVGEGQSKIMSDYSRRRVLLSSWYRIYVVAELALKLVLNRKSKIETA